MYVQCQDAATDRVQVEGRMDAMVDMHLEDQSLLYRLRELQGDTIARLRTTFEIQDAATEAAHALGDSQS